MSTWYEYIRVDTFTNKQERMELKCDSALEFYVCLNAWNRQSRRWFFYSPCDWGNCNIHGKVFEQRVKES